jgi:hypothetical protein
LPWLVIHGRGGAKEGHTAASLPKQRVETKKGKWGSAWARHMEKKRRGSDGTGKAMGPGGAATFSSDGGWRCRAGGGSPARDENGGAWLGPGRKENGPSRRA